MNKLYGPTDQINYLVTLAHIEYLGSIEAGHFEQYATWAQFIGVVTLQIAIPQQEQQL